MLLKLHCTLVSENDVSKVFLRLELFFTLNKSFPLVKLHINEINLVQSGSLCTILDECMALWDKLV